MNTQEVNDLIRSVFRAMWPVNGLKFQPVPTDKAVSLYLGGMTLKQTATELSVDPDSLKRVLSRISTNDLQEVYGK